MKKDDFSKYLLATLESALMYIEDFIDIHGWGENGLASLEMILSVVFIQNTKHQEK